MATESLKLRCSVVLSVLRGLHVGFSWSPPPCLEVKTGVLCAGGQLRKVGGAVNACGARAARRAKQTNATPV
eukprot:3556042-Alexandrium_andersonii.AAC.1